MNLEHYPRKRSSARHLGAAFGLCALLFCFTPTKAEANTEFAGLIFALLVAGVVEIVVPDTWLELGDDGTAADLSWPLVMTLARIGDFEPFGGYLRGVAEVHLESGDWNARGVFGGRLDLLVDRDELGLGFFAEGGYVVGADSNAPMVGGGLIADNFGWTAVLLMYRATFVEELRHEVTLNLEIALPVFTLYQEAW